MTEPWGLCDHSRKSRVAAVGEFRLFARWGHNEFAQCANSSDYPMAVGRIFEDYVGGMCGT